MDKLNVIVKVGKSSKLRLRNVKCHRAITFEDINHLIEKYNSSAIIIEDIQSYEVMDAVECINNIKERGIETFICNYDRHEHIDGVGRKTNTEVSKSLSELQHNIAKAIAVSVYTDWKVLDRIDDFNDLSFIASNGEKKKKVIDISDTLDITHEDEIEEETEKIRDREQEVEKREQELYDLLQAVTKEKNNLEEEVNNKSSRISQLMGMVESLTEQSEMYKSLIDEIDSYEVEYQEVTGDEELKKELEKKELELKESRTETVEKDTIINNMLRERGELESKIEILNDKAELLDESKIKVEELKRTNSEISAKLIEYEAEKREWVISEQEYENKLQESFNKIGIMQRKISSLEERWSNLNEQQADVAEIEERLKKSESSNSDYLSQISKLNTEKTELITSQVELEQQIAALQAQIRDLKSSAPRTVINDGTDEQNIKRLEEEINDLTKLTKSLRTKLSNESNARFIFSSMLNQSLTAIAEEEDETRKREERIDKLNRSIEELEEQAEESRNKYNSLNKKYADKVNRLEELKNEKDSLQRETDERLAILTSEIQKLRKEKEESSADKKELEAKITELELKAAEIQMESDSKTAMADKAQKEMLHLEEKLESKEQEIEALNTNLLDTQEELRQKTEEGMQLERAVDDGLTREKELSTSVKTLNLAVSKAIKELNETKRKLATAEANNRMLENSHSKLNQSFLNLVSAGNGVTSAKIKFNCEYRGSAKIVPVFGAGSYGITNIAMALAKTIKNSKILLMDLDLMGGKLDVFVKRAPIINELKEIAQPYNRTALCSFLEKGYKYFEEHKGQIIQELKETKARSNIGYFSGLCGKLNISKAVQADFNTLLNELGNEYDYIIADLGKIGSSEVQDAMIKMFVDICVQGIFVTLNDGATCRNASVRMQLAELNTEKLYWILNLATTTAADELTRKSVGKCNYSIIQQEMKIYNQHITLDKVVTLKPKIREIAEFLEKQD